MEVDQILQGDCREVLKQFEDNYFDAICTDPPYELTSSKTAKTGFMGKAWDGSGIAYNVNVWQECLRVLKPGGHMLAFGGTRTYHRMACAIEDAGFEIRDSLHWVYGSGFPKSLSIGRAIDKMEGNSVGSKYLPDPDNKIYGSGKCKAAGVDRTPGAILSDPAISDAAKQWAGYGTALKPAHEPIVLVRKPLSESTIAGNVLRWGCGGLNIDACRVSTSDNLNGGGYSNGESKGMWTPGKEGGGFGRLPGEFEQPTGRFPANLIWSHSPNCKRIGTKKVKGNAHFSYKPAEDGGLYKLGLKQLEDAGNPFADADGMETIESWDCAPDCPSWEFAKAGDRKVGFFNGHRNKPKTKNDFGIFKLQDEAPSHEASTGSAARFFKSCQFTEEDIPAFAYYAKASRSEREKGLDGMPLRNNMRVNAPRECESDKVAEKTRNFHPTVKPLALMRYLCRLICPPGGLVLDPFAGSGTTCLAAKLEGFGYIGIEKEVEYCDIARRRIAAIPARLDRWATP